MGNTSIQVLGYIQHLHDLDTSSKNNEPIPLYARFAYYFSNLVGFVVV